MRTFNYTARSLGGGQVTGVAEANSREEAINQLKESNLIVVSIAEANAGSRDIDLGLGSRKAKEKSLSIVCNQFSILLKAGLPIVRTIEMIANQTDDKTLKRILTEAAADVAAGYRLADSLEKHGSDLPTTFVESIRAGEESGALETVFGRLKDYYEKTSRTKAKVRSAMVYPVFVMVIAVVVVAIIMIFAVPTFRDTFNTLGGEMPWITQMVINVSDFMVHWWWILVAIVILAILAVNIGKRNERFRVAWSKLGVQLPIINVKTPIVGKINLMGAAAEYAGTMSVMMAAGLPIVQAVGVTARSMNNYYLGQSLENTMPDLEAGRPLAVCLANENTLPQLAIEMTAVGEQTGSLESTMEVLSEYYDNEVETATSRAMSLLEPMIIVVLAVIVFVLLLSVYLPMFTMYGSV